MNDSKTETAADVPRADLVQVGYALQMAAILLRDLDGAMPPEVRASMPADLRNRMGAPFYQESFYLLPEDVQQEARALVQADPDIQAARAVDAGGRS